MMKVFLGGTCGNSKWRDKLIPMLNVDYFNPVVEDWTPECMDEELRQRETCDIIVYTITPYMIGAFSVAEVVDDSNKRPEKTIFCILEEDGEHGRVIWSPAQFKSMSQVARMVSTNGATVVNTLGALARAINERAN